MYRAVLAFVMAIAAISYAATAADDKKPADTKKADDKKETKIEGKLVCTKCTMKETKECGHAVKVMENGKEVVYYLKDKGAKETYHKAVCPKDSESDVKVTGKLSEKDGKKTLDDVKVEVKK